MELLAPHINVNQKQNQIDICTDAGQANQIKIFAQNSSLSFQKRLSMRGLQDDDQPLYVDRPALL